MYISIEQAESHYDDAVDEISRLNEECGSLKNSLQLLKAEIFAILSRSKHCCEMFDVWYTITADDYDLLLQKLSAVH